MIGTDLTPAIEAAIQATARDVSSISPVEISKLASATVARAERDDVALNVYRYTSLIISGIVEYELGRSFEEIIRERTDPAERATDPAEFGDAERVQEIVIRFLDDLGRRAPGVALAFTVGHIFENHGTARIEGLNG